MNPNPYTPPGAPLSDPATDPAAGRLILVRVLSLFYGFAAVLSIVGRYFFTSHPQLIPPSMRAQFLSPSWVDNAVWIAANAIKLCAAVSLYRRKSYCVELVTMLFALAVLNTLRHIIFKEWPQNTPGPAMVGTAVGFAISIAVIRYLARLRARGAFRGASA